MNKFFSLAVCICFYITSVAQGGSWVWVKGGKGFNGPGVLGTQGVAGAANTPEAYYEASTWIDLQGNLWIFGGVDSNDAVGNDLWKFDPTNNSWAWMRGSGGLPYVIGSNGVKGVPSPNNYPSATGWGALTWTDARGNFWLMGGNGVNTVDQLWKYNLTTAEWTWIAGNDTGYGAPVYGTQGIGDPANTPGGRTENNSTWVDAQGHLWLFGGMSISSGNYYNDVWEFDPATNNWIYITGPQGTGDMGNYGTLNVSTPNTVPPARACYTRWKDAAGNFYIFGGARGPELDSSFRDIWKFSPASRMWTWIGGDDSLNAQGNYVDGQCNYSGYYGPGSRTENRTAQVTGCTNAFISFGGYPTIYDTLPSGMVEYDNPVYNDLWLYNTTTETWKWLSGTDTLNSTGNYGTMGVPAATNMIPGRCGQSQWLDQNGILWMFAGLGDIIVPEAVGENCYNDIWKFIPDESCLNELITSGLVAHLSAPAICSGDSVLLTISGNNSAASIYPSTGVYVVSNSTVYLSPLITTTYTLVAASGCGASDTARVTVTVNNPDSINYVLTDANICSGDSTYLGIYYITNPQISPATYYWGDQGHTYAQLTPPVTTTYTVTGQSSVCNVNDTLRVTILVNQHTPVNVTLSDSVICTGDSAYVGITGLSSISISPITGVFATDSADYYLNPGQNTSYTIYGISSCGSYISIPLSMYVTSPNNVSYYISDSTICAGDTALLKVLGLTNVSITPTTGLTWLTGSSALVHPAQTTTYTISGSSGCGYSSVQLVTVYVQRGSALNYFISDTNWCNYYTEPILSVVDNSSYTISPDIDVYHALGPPSYYQFELDSTITYTITGTSTCGYADTARVTIHKVQPAVTTLTDSVLCPGNSTTMFISGIQDVVISPSSGFSYVDSTHILFYPGATTVYTITGLTPCGAYSATHTIYVNIPGVLNYSLSKDTICAGSVAGLTTYDGFSTLTILPQTGYYYTTTDSINYYYFEPQQTTTFTIYGQSQCGYEDSATFTIYVDTLYTMSNTNICNGDSVYINLTGLMNVYIYPDTDYVWTDSTQIAFFPSTPTQYEISGSGKCNAYVYNYFYISSYNTGPLYNMGDSVICPPSAGGAAYVTINNQLTNIHVSPSAGITYLGQDYLQLTPDTTTIYTLTGTDACGLHQVQFTVTVIQPGVLSYTLTDSLLCQYDETEVYLYMHNGVYEAIITPGSGYPVYDSIVALYPYAPVSTFHIVAYSSCGVDSGTVTLYTQSPGVVNYSLADTIICLGSSTQMALYQLANAQIVPSTGVTWTDSSHVIFHPTVTTTYRITGISPACGYIDTSVIVIHVETPGHPFVTIDSNVCTEGLATVQTVDLSNVQISPASGPWGWWYWPDTAQASFQGNIDTPLTFMLTGYSQVCGDYDTIHFTVRQISNISLSGSALCYGDTAKFTFLGMSDFNISPATNLLWRDSSLLLVFPDTNTLYTVTCNTLCGYPVTLDYQIDVSKPSVLNYSLSPQAPMCSGDYADLIVYDADSVNITPDNSVTGSYVYYLRPDSTTTYLVTAVSTGCGTHDTAHIMVPVIQPAPISYSIIDTPLCSGDTARLLIQGLHNVLVTYPYGDYTVVDSALLYLYSQYYSYTYQIQGNTSCGSIYNINIPLNITVPANPNAYLNNLNICIGDTGIVILSNIYNPVITPAATVRWLNNDTAYLIPDSSITYHLTGQTSCGSNYSQDLPVYLQANVLHYTLWDTVQCAGNLDELDITNGYNTYSDFIISPITNVYNYGTYAYLEPDTTTTYTISAMLCNRPDTQQFTIYVPGQQNINYTLSPTSICTGDTTILNIIGSESVTISPDSYTNQNNLGRITFYPPVTTTYTVISYNICYVYDTLAFTVTVGAPAGSTATLSKNEWCGNDSATLTLAGIYNLNLTPATGVRWVDSLHAVLHPLQTTTYILSGYNTCNLPFTDTLGIAVHTLPLVTLTGDSVLCQGSSTQLCATAGFAGYSWSNGASTACITPDSSGAYTVNITDNNGCTASPAVINVTLHTPMVRVTASADSICPGDSAQICATAGFSSYTWNTGTATACFYTGAVGNYYVTVADSYHCSAISNHVLLGQYTLPHNFVVVHNDTLYAEYPATTYQWYLNSVLLTGDTGRVVIGTENGLYELVAYDVHGCHTTAQSKFQVGIGNIAPGNNIKVYPNPLQTGYWHVDVTDKMVGSAFEVYDATGRIIYHSELKSTRNEIWIDVAAGVYVMRVLYAGNAYNFKLVRL